jgi:oligopeptide transport system substrate-binding protein
MAAAALCLSACGQHAQDSGIMVLNRGNGGEPNTLDPAYAQTQAETNIVQDLMVGLTTPAGDGTTMQGAAESWYASPDGMIWTFHLRDFAWSDGTPVTADDFLYAWRRVLDPKSAVDYASILYLFKNAAAVKAGKLPVDALGVRALDDKTIQIVLEHPAPYLEELLTHTTALPVPRHVVEAKGKLWSRPGNYVSDGAYVLKDWVPEDHIALEKNPHFYDAAHVAINEVNYYPISDDIAALKRFRAHELDTQNQFPPEQIDWLRANMPDALQTVPDLVTYYVCINMRRPALQDLRIREALNLAIDRETVVNKIRKLGEPAAYSIVPPAMANFPSGAAMDFKALSSAERIAKARALMQAAGYGPDHPLHLSYLTPSGNYAIRLAQAFQAMWREAYIDVDIAATEPATVFQRKSTGDFDLAYSTWIADYNDAYNFLGIRLQSQSGMNDSGYSSPAFDALIAEAQAERDMAKRGAALREAEDIALKDYPWIPYRFGVTPDLVQPYVKGWIANPKNVNLSRWLSIDHGNDRK